MNARITLRRFGRHRGGAAAVEFALLVPMTLALIFSTFEIGWAMLQSIMLDRALDTTIRELRIGTMTNPTLQRVRQRVCQEAMVLANCETALALEFIPIVNASSYPTDAERCVDRSNPIAPVLRYDPGLRSQTVFVRACFVVDPLTPGLGIGLALPKDGSGAYRLIARSGYVNEPM